MTSLILLFVNFLNNKSKRDRSTSLTASLGATGSLLKKSSTISIENYLLKDCPNTAFNESEIIIDVTGKSIWNPRSEPYTVSVISYDSAKKYAGLKAFIIYNIKTEKLPNVINRRYNQFLWLYNCLKERYPNICLPTLPEKTMTGNFDENFIERRKRQLELWLNRLSAHPVIRENESFIHFLMADSSKWKQGKRKAENENLTGAQWMYTVQAPNAAIFSSSAGKDNFEKFSKSACLIDNRLRDIISSVEKMSKKESIYKRVLVNFGGQLGQFGVALSDENWNAESNELLCNAFVTAGNTYTQIGNMYGEQAKVDIDPLSDKLALYRRVLQKVGQCVQFEKSSLQVYESLQARQDRLVGIHLEDLIKRKDIVTHVTFAEINLINRQKVGDLTAYMREFLGEQVKFYAEITECLKEALKGFDDLAV